MHAFQPQYRCFAFKAVRRFLEEWKGDVLDVGVGVRSDKSTKVMAMKDEDGFLETHIDLKPCTLSHTRA